MVQSQAGVKLYRAISGHTKGGVSKRETKGLSSNAKNVAVSSLGFGSVYRENRTSGYMVLILSKNYIKISERKIKSSRKTTLIRITVKGGDIMRFIDLIKEGDVLDNRLESLIFDVSYSTVRAYYHNDRTRYDPSQTKCRHKVEQTALYFIALVQSGKFWLVMKMLNRMQALCISANEKLLKEREEASKQKTEV